MWLHKFVPITFVWLISAGPSAIVDSSSNDIGASKCRPLPDLPPETSASGEDSITLLNLLGKGPSELFPESESIPHDVVLILGNTGSGKTTLTQMIAGDLTKLHAVETEEGDLFIIDDGEKIGTPGTTSRTIIPELVITENGSFFDCPGFDDNRGPLHDVAVSYFMNQITQRVTRIKLIFLINQNSVTIAKDRNELDRLVSHAVRFVKALTRFQTSIGLVVTKVERYVGRSRRRRTDDEIIGSVVRFLTTYKTNVQKKLRSEAGIKDRDTNLRRIEFVNFLLNNDTGTYSHITFSTSPDSCGRLSESDAVKDTRSRVLSLIGYLNFTGIGDFSANFGFTLKAETLQKVREDYTKEINEAVGREISEQISNFQKLYNTVYTDCMNSLPIGSELLNIWANIDNIEIEDDTFLTNISAELCLWFFAMGYNCSQQFKEFMAEKDTYLEFFDKVTESKVERKAVTWINSINVVKEVIKSDRDNFKLDISPNRVNKVNQLIISQVQNETNSILEQINEVLNKDADVLPMMSNPVWLMLSQGDKFNNDFPASPIQFAELVARLVESLGPISLSENFIENLTKAEEDFNFFENFLQKPVIKQVEAWKKPLLAIQNKLDSERVNMFRKIRIVYAPESNNRALECFHKIERNFIIWFSEEKAKEVKNYPRVSEQMQNRWNLPIATLNLSSSRPVDVLKMYNNTTYRMGYALSSEDEQCVTNESRLLDFFDNVLEEKFPRPVRDWGIPIGNMQQLVLDYRKEYHNLLDNKFVPEANDGITSIMLESLENFISRSENSMPQNIENTDDFIERLDNLKLDLHNVANPFYVTFDTELRAVFVRFGFTAPSSYQVIQKHLADLRFFDAVKGTSVLRRYTVWKELIVNTITKVDNIRSKSIARAQQRWDEINDETTTQISNVMNQMDKDLDKKITGMNSSLVKTTLQSASYRIHNFKGSKNLTMVCGGIRDTFNQYLGVVVSADFVTGCSRNELTLQKLERVSELDRVKNDSVWLSSLSGSLQRIMELQSWYKFCDEVTEALAQYSFQVSKPAFSSFSPWMWSQFLERQGQIQVPLSILQIGETQRKLDSVHFGHLIKLIENELDTVNISCTNGITVANGNYIRFGDVIHRLKHTGCSNFNGVEIYAKNVVFIDSDFSNDGNIRVILVAPVIEVVGKREINLGGRDGSPHIPAKAKNGKHTGAKEFEEAGAAVGVPLTATPGKTGNREWIKIKPKRPEQEKEVSPTNPTSQFHMYLQALRSGSHGMSGSVGGQGGSFMSISSKILKASDLMVISKGGTGGRGQDGGDGADGNSCSVEPNTACFWTAYIGGNGGDGGTGGRGGNPGRIDIFAEHTRLVITERKTGKHGTPGTGGLAGTGGRGASGQECQTKWFAFWEWEKCTAQAGSNSKDGKRGYTPSPSGEGGEICQTKWFLILRLDDCPAPVNQYFGISYAKRQYSNIYGSTAAENIFTQWE